MATVHPSRMGMVPGAASLPPKPPASLPPSLSREQELRQKLLQRRNGQGSNRGKELLPEAGSSSRSSLESTRERSRSHSPVRISEPRSTFHPLPPRPVERQTSPPRAYRQYEDRPRENEARRQGISPVRDLDPSARYSSRSPERRHRASSQGRDHDEGRYYRNEKTPDTGDRYPERSSRRPNPAEDYQGPSGSRRPDYESPRRAAMHDGRSPRQERHFSPRRDSRPPPPHMNSSFRPPPPDLVRSAPPPPGFSQHRPPPRYMRGPIDFESRRLQREASTLSVWPPSPKEPYMDEEELEARRKAEKKARKSKRRAKYSSDDDSGSSDSEYERRRRRRKERRQRREYSDLELGSEDERRKERRRKRRSETREREFSRTKSATPAVAVKDHAEADQWVEKAGNDTAAVRPEDSADVPAEDEEVEVGPQLPKLGMVKEKRPIYTDMLPGEAEAMAAYAAAGQRIPRRGEIGLDADQIEAFESSGYVMSGSRNKRMNAVRLRKENQVINAEEKRAILLLQREEKVRKEGLIISQFKEMMDENLRKQGLKKI